MYPTRQTSYLPDVKARNSNRHPAKRALERSSFVKTHSEIAAQRRADAELLRLAQEGNEEAFSSLFQAHKAKVYALCLRMTGNTGEAEDLTQDAFFQVFRKIGNFRGESAFSTWLYRVTMNTVLMHFRKKGTRNVSLEEPVTRTPGAPKREFGIDDERLSGCVDRIVLARAMKELPSGYRTVFLMHEVRGYDHREIAGLLRCSIGNSKSQLHRAKARMRELMTLKTRPEQVASSPLPDCVSFAETSSAS
jgi:RNA polymerase sigma-70 factor (ECF subfamily)